ncbi:alpha-N-acetylgalactosaminide alpha-2,6-sialyltransferase 3 isoform X2 [Rhinatrema bivittatum]|uniref:alpha-N-acetylgalactosaminide alpha-2,6-sialyltransferase 3 isoform X2 n=1 Tax=Rhinatrema bivittatum TaxID=194408 RepID=UPI00112AD183|nr:alpha-N-acetylgalactosaminide alpha-2,6-sialyltransferase 3 isoform X2 [Rhinatrema bivittatum]
MACILKRKLLVVAVGFIVAFFFLIVLRLINEINFPLLLTSFEKPITRWIPFSYPRNQSLRTHYGYINLRTQEPLQLDCDLCAIVSNSGQMSGQRIGKEIDQSSCVWRMNSAPTKGYEEDVGRRTTIRVVSHTSVPLLLKNPAYFFKEANSTLYVIWGPFRNLRKDGSGVVYNMLKKAVDRYADAKIYLTTEKRMSYCDGVFKKETGKDRSEGFRKVPYHYYEPGRNECDEYFLHENAPYGGHRFITEKKVFARWAKKSKITFTHPDWTVS